MLFEYLDTMSGLFCGETQLPAEIASLGDDWLNDFSDVKMMVEHKGASLLLW